ncbi:cell division protein anillin-domain-containing protein [Bombardia bombarda]|uniref:Cell division protein anillin-domain-containing protein n=1 Tax=Bombardia bombarda TaxID=252184 RepID=A0AA40CA57_9PEZI|nr:cell division protein anillin-domain-containing protein [Bombardia bombarda]
MALQPSPLSEISAGERRRNSGQMKKMLLNSDFSSPFQSSPDGAPSPRLFWNRFENAPRGGSPSPTRRSSIERLQKASRVKNSNILALEQKQEYDPTKVPVVERPLSKVQGNAYSGTGVGGLRTAAATATTAPAAAAAAAAAADYWDLNGHNRTNSKNSIVLPPPVVRPSTPVKDQPSPIKSALTPSRFKSSFDKETGAWGNGADALYDEYEEAKSPYRHTKSVKFDAAPPQVNEYEMATPDLSSIGSNSREGSYDSTEDDDEDDHYLMHDGDIQDDSFDASLEDTDKTPVVGPDDWRQDSHSHHSNDNDPFENSPMPEDARFMDSNNRPQHNRTDSSTSDHRPLPPLPGMSGLSLPSPPPLPVAAGSDSQNIGNGKMTLEERLKLMMLSDDGKNDSKTAAEQQRERRMRRAGHPASPHQRTDSQTPEREREHRSPHAAAAAAAAAAAGGQLLHDEEAEEADDTIGDLEEYQLPPRISRESIMRRVNGNAMNERQSDYNFSSPAPSLSPERRLMMHYDPDVPIPSTEEEEEEEEDSMLDFEGAESDGEGSVIVTRDGQKDDGDAYSFRSGDGQDEKHHPEDDTDSQYSVSDTESSVSAESQDGEEDQVSTPRQLSPVNAANANANANATAPAPPHRDTSFTGSLELTNSRGGSKDIDFSKGLESFMLARPDEPIMTNEPEKGTMAPPPRPATPEQRQQIKKKLTRTLTKPEYDGSGWGEPEDEDEEEMEDDEPGTPDSVIHHPMPEEEEPSDTQGDLPAAVPEQLATIKSAVGSSKLKTRPSATPSDIMAMREARRHVSREVPPSMLLQQLPVVPAIPERHRNHRMSRDMEAEIGLVIGDDAFLGRHPSFKKRSLTLDLDLGLSLDKDFERVIEAQKRGYLMRQNTKLVAASDKESDDLRGGFRSAGNSPVKPARPQSWTVEPWNGQPRKRSVKYSNGGARGGPVPPLPGKESNAVPHAMGSLVEEDATSEMSNGNAGESGERGRLFVKVMGVKDLDMPIPKNERTWFSLTLDNGVHCVTTAWLELARNAPIGQEFELVVPNELEFQLTLNVKLDKPAPVLPSSSSNKKLALPPSPTKMTRPRGSTFSRVFASPKKRKEMELMRQREEEELRLAHQQQQQREAQARQMKTQPTAWDLLSPLAADDGSFARSYVCLKEHETRCFGRPYLVEVAAFNEWATEEANFASSVKSKRGNQQAVVRRAPYKIGKLELQLLFVPRPKGATDEDMPKSMNSCIREMKAAEERLAHNYEGHLSQQGGIYWRRRYFKLVGTKLTAYHESTRQPRATINLANAKRLIDDRRALTEKEITGKNGKRRRSAFAEEEDGYMFVEEGFRIRFNNGELIDFYADSTQDKNGWMRVLSEVIGRDSLGPDDDASSMNSGSGSRARSKWCELVLKREEAMRRRSERPRVHSRTKSMFT